MNPPKLVTLEDVLNLLQDSGPIYETDVLRAVIQDIVERRDEARTLLWLVKLWRDSPAYAGNFESSTRHAIEKCFEEPPHE